MVLVSLEAQEALRQDLEAAMRRFPPTRPADWRGPNARGGRRLSSQAAPLAGDLHTQPPQVQQVTSLPRQGQEPVGNPADAGTYWDALTRLGGHKLASDVQGKLIRFVKDLTLEEIEVIAKEDSVMAT